jgi:hypothetical protein
MGNAFSYTRFSSKRRESGSSLEDRQVYSRQTITESSSLFLLLVGKLQQAWQYSGSLLSQDESQLPETKGAGSSRGIRQANNTFLSGFVDWQTETSRS